MFLIVFLLATVGQIDSTKISGIKARKISTTYIDLHWHRVRNVSTYYVSYKAIYEQEYHVIESSTNGVRITGLEPRTSYQIKVRTQLDYVPEDKVHIYITNAVNIPKDVPVVKIVNIGRSNATLSWEAIPDSIIYHVAYKEMGFSTYKTKRTRNTSIELEGLKTATLYLVKIQVGNSYYGSSKWSTPVEILTKPEPPTAPINPRVCDETVTKSKRIDLLLCWSQPKEINGIYQDDITYSVNWCIINPRTLKPSGCYEQFKILHTTMYPFYQTFHLEDLEYGSSVWFRVTAYASDDKVGGKASGQYKVQDNPYITATIEMTATAATVPHTAAHLKSESIQNKFVTHLYFVTIFIIVCVML